MNKLEKIKEAAWEYLGKKENYPKDQGDCWYVSGGEGRRSHPASLKSWALREIFEEGNFFNKFDHYSVSQDGWQRIVLIQGDVARKFIFENLTLTEKQLDRILFDHGLELSENTVCGPKNTWMCLKRFNKVLDYYAVYLSNGQQERVINKIGILIDRTGYKLEDIIEIKS